MRMQVGCHSYMWMERDGGWWVELIVREATSHLAAAELVALISKLSDIYGS